MTVADDLEGLPVVPGSGRGHDEQWLLHAACLGAPEELWFPEDGGAHGLEGQRVCASCPVRVDCLQYALAEVEIFGTWGGASERVRRFLRHFLQRCPHVDRPRRIAGCACRFCVELDAHEVRMGALRAGVTPPALDTRSPGESHGKASTYGRGCRCADCREAKRVQALRRRTERAAERADVEAS